MGWQAILLYLALGLNAALVARYARSECSFFGPKITQRSSAFGLVARPVVWLGYGALASALIYIYIYISHKPLKGRGVPPSCVRWPLVSNFVLKCIKVAN